jgi:hypothetical protein
VEGDPPIADDGSSDDDLQISVNAITGIVAPMTMHLHVEVAGTATRALVDFGSTHCFVADAAACRLGLTPVPRPGLTIGVANDDRIPSSGFCPAVPFCIANEDFTCDFFATPLGEYEVVLKYQWLRTLGPILWDFDKLSMPFWRLDRQVHWQGLNAPAGAHLRALDNSDLLKLLIAEFAAIFAEPQGLPPPRCAGHRIHLLPRTPPVAVRPYRYPQLLKDEIEKQCAEMLCQGIIRPDTSPFSSPVLLVPKKDGTWRFCADYRALNSKMVKDKFPIPIVDELLDELRGARFFTKLDLRSGYHQVRMFEDDIAKTAFRTHHGHFEFVVMAFGLTNAPSTFQALMNDVLRDFLRCFVLVFFDDILIYSSTWTEHLQHVCTVFQVLQDKNLALK